MILDWQVDNKTYRDQGSYRFTFAQRRSMILAFDVEIVSVALQPYVSAKSVPPNGHYGYAVIFHGSTPVKRVDLEFPVTRIFRSQNDLATLAVGLELLGKRILEGEKIAYDCLTPAVKNCFTFEIVNPEGVTLPGHPETVVKVKTNPLCQFNMIAYWVEIPDLGLTNINVDGSDGSDGLDEFPEPSVNGTDDPFGGNPPESERDPRNDPRDYSSRPLLPGEGVKVKFSVLADPGGCAPGVSYETMEYGPFVGFGRVVSTADGAPNPACPGTTLGFRIVFEDGTVLGPIESGAGVYSASIISQVIV